MSSWWDFGEESGYPGEDLAPYLITCGFCGEKGPFKTENHLEKKHPKTEKVLNYDTLKCANCGNFTMTFWSAGRGKRIESFCGAQPAQKLCWTERPESRGLLRSMEFSAESLACSAPVATTALCEWGDMIRARGRGRYQSGARTRTKPGRPSPGLAATAALGSGPPLHA